MSFADISLLIYSGRSISIALSTSLSAFYNIILFEKITCFYVLFSEDLTLFNEEDKRAYRDAHFETDLKNAYDLGCGIAAKAKSI
ncbi:MAG: hypothetical protein J5897_07235 [Candidatus Methanomethylophilus sp.]|nr:hypothetical protein [Methanomethylophilus sp.]